MSVDPWQTRAALVAALEGSGGGGSPIWGGITGTLSSQTDLQTALNAKQNSLVSGTNIKTINGVSVLGSGDLLVGGSNNLDGGSAASTYGGANTINGGGASG